MKLTTRERDQVLMTPPPSRASTREPSEFRRRCDAAGQHVSTIRKRLAANPELTLDEALAMRRATPTECGQQGARRSRWARY